MPVNPAFSSVRTVFDLFQSMGLPYKRAPSPKFPHSFGCCFTEHRTPTTSLGVTSDLQGFRCTACGLKGSGVNAVARLLSQGVHDPIPAVISAKSSGRIKKEPLQGCTVAQLAQAKGLTRDTLIRAGWMDSDWWGTLAVMIPYYDETGHNATRRYRVGLTSSDRFRWKSKAKLRLYGLQVLPEIRRQGYVILVEGETNTLSLWQHGIPALGVPGKANWKAEWASLLHGLDIYVWPDPDDAEDQKLVRDVASAINPVHVITSPADVKAANDLMALDPPGFAASVARLIEGAALFVPSAPEAPFGNLLDDVSFLEDLEGPNADSGPSLSNEEWEDLLGAYQREYSREQDPDVGFVPNQFPQIDPSVFQKHYVTMKRIAWALEDRGDKNIPAANSILKCGRWLCLLQYASGDIEGKGCHCHIPGCPRCLFARCWAMFLSRAEALAYVTQPIILEATDILVTEPLLGEGVKIDTDRAARSATWERLARWRERKGTPDIALNCVFSFRGRETLDGRMHYDLLFLGNDGLDGRGRTPEEALTWALQATTNKISRHLVPMTLAPSADFPLTVVKRDFADAIEGKARREAALRYFQQWAALPFMPPDGDEYNDEYLIWAEAMKGKKLVQGCGVFYGIEARPKVPVSAGINPVTGEMETFKQHSKQVAPKSWFNYIRYESTGRKHWILKPEKSLEQARSIAAIIYPEDEGYDPENALKRFEGQPGTWQSGSG